VETQVIEITAELIEEEEGGYTVYCPELDIYTQGEDVEEALANLKEAAELHIEEIGVQNLKLRKVERRELTLQIYA
jgi:predicted RNase H-like HicB family nuclease